MLFQDGALRKGQGMGEGVSEQRRKEHALLCFSHLGAGGPPSPAPFTILILYLPSSVPSPSPCDQQPPPEHH